MTNQQVKIGIEGGMFDNYALDCFRNCPQYYFWRIVKGVVKPGAKKTAADFGTAIHLALEHYYKEGMTDESIKGAFQVFATSFASKQDATDDKRTLAKGLEILAKYFDKYRHEAFNVVATEVGGVFELGDYLYTFRIDLVTELFTPKGICGDDHKTTSSLSRMIAKPHNQVTGYYDGLLHHYENVVGFVVNCVGVYKGDKQKDKSTGKMVKRELFNRLFTNRTLREVKDWESETLHLIKQIEGSTVAGVWPKYSGFCTAYSSRCQYLDLCQAQDGEQILIPMLEAEIYVKEPWVPYQGEEGGGEE